eukprot:190903-Prymnesium_polylepis.2
MVEAKTEHPQCASEAGRRALGDDHTPVLGPGLISQPAELRRGGKALCRAQVCPERVRGRVKEPRHVRRRAAVRVRHGARDRCCCTTHVHAHGRSFHSAQLLQQWKLHERQNATGRRRAAKAIEELTL